MHKQDGQEHVATNCSMNLHKTETAWHKGSFWVLWKRWVISKNNSMDKYLTCASISVCWSYSLISRIQKNRRPASSYICKVTSLYPNTDKVTSTPTLSNRHCIEAGTHCGEIERQPRQREGTSYLGWCHGWLEPRGPEEGAAGFDDEVGQIVREMKAGQCTERKGYLWTQFPPD